MKRQDATKRRVTPRAFVRDGSLTIRMPATFKTKLMWLAGEKKRDTSNLALEYLFDGVARHEAENSGRTTATE